MNKIKSYMLSLLALVGLGFAVGCQDSIDMSDRYTFTEETVAQYLQHEDNYSEYYKLLGQVKISSRSESTVLQLMSARGHFTVFPPDNQAIQEYLDGLQRKGLISSPSWEGFDGNEKRLDSIRKVIVFNSIIDGGDDVEAIQTSNFPQSGKEFNQPNMNDRKLTFFLSQGLDSMFINGTKNDDGRIIGGALIDESVRNILASNGYIHGVHSVIAPSNATLADVMKDFIDMGDTSMIVTAKMIEACGLFDTLSKVKDDAYEQAYLTNAVPNLGKHPTFQSLPGYMPEHRKFGFTIFAETPAFWKSVFPNKDIKDITVEDLQGYAQKLYPEATDDNFKSTNNALNKFITYHLLPEKLSADRLVIHYNEKGYNYKTSTRPTIATYELYTTMGEPRLLKLYEGGASPAPQGVFINRFPVLDNGRHGTYHETNDAPLAKGFKVNTEEVQSVINGYIYPIESQDLANAPLVWDDATATNFQKQRLRFDVSSMFPEFINNDIRANRTKTNQNLCVGIPCDNVYKYCNGLDIAEGTNFYYLLGLDLNWQNWEGDEFNVTGRYEMIMKLPPVPKKGTYEIRYAVQTNTAQRGMCQVYFGDNKDNLPAIGIPLDLRMGGINRRTSAGTFPSIVGWVEDNANDDDFNAEIDKKMRNNGFMKGAESYSGTPGAQTARTFEYNTRRIIVRQDMEPGKTYYLKFKSVLDDETREFYMDYLEYCAKEVYDNPMTPEDIW